MLLIEAFYDSKIRRSFKRYLMATGLSLNATDCAYELMGQYLSRLKVTGLADRLAACPNEREFRALLTNIFDRLWAGHTQNVDTPRHLLMYLDYLHTRIAIHPDLEIAGLDVIPDDTIYGSPGRFEAPYLKNGRLNIIANPRLIRKLYPLMQGPNPDHIEASAVAQSFYFGMFDDMTLQQWALLVKNIWKKERFSRTRNIRLTEQDGSSRIFSGPDAMMYVAGKVGFDNLASCNVMHQRDKIIVRNVPGAYSSYYKPLNDGRFINLKGNTNMKAKTIKVLSSFFRLGLTVEVCEDAPDKL